MRRPILCLLAGLLAVALPGPTASAGSAAPRARFSSPVVLSRLDAGIGGLATAFAWARDGRVFVARKKGVVDVYDHGIRHVFVDLSDEVNSAQGRGLLGLALDPHFERDGWVYVMFTRELHPSHPDSRANAGGEIVRLRAPKPRGDAADLATRHVLVSGFQSRAPQHADGALRFDAHGDLFATWGDGTADGVNPHALAAQSLDDLRGKLIRVDPRTGAGVRGNPWFDRAHPHAVRSQVYAFGFRNPYRFSIDPGNGTVYLGDVGSSQWDELDAITAHSADPMRDRNGGWPCYEGGNGRSVAQPFYRAAPRTGRACLTVYPPKLGGTGPGAEPPLYAYPHLTGACITVGPKYAGTSNYPPKYKGRIFVADWSRDTFQTVDATTGAAAPFGRAGTWGQPVDVQIAPDGNVAYLAYATGELREISYSG